MISYDICIYIYIYMHMFVINIHSEEPRGGLAGSGQGVHSLRGVGERHDGSGGPPLFSKGFRSVERSPLL